MMFNKLSVGTKARNKLTEDIIFKLYTLITWLKGKIIKRTLNIK